MRLEAVANLCVLVRSCVCWCVPASCVCGPFQAKYKELSRKEVGSNLYSLLPSTMETQHARESSELLSEVSSPQRPSLSRTHQARTMLNMG